MVTLNGCLYVYFKGAKEIQRFNGIYKYKRDPIAIPEKVGEVHTICSSGVLLISGDRGYTIYDTHFSCISEFSFDLKLK